MGEIKYKLADGSFRREMVDSDWDVLVRAAMHRLGIDSIADLVSALGVSRNLWYKWMRGDCRPSDQTRQKLASLAGFAGKTVKKAS